MNKLESINNELKEIHGEEALLVMDSDDFHELVVNPQSETLAGLVSSTKEMGECKNFNIEDKFFAYDKHGQEAYKSWNNVDDIRKSVEELKRTSVQDKQKRLLNETLDTLLHKFNELSMDSEEGEDNAAILKRREHAKTYSSLYIIKKIVEDTFEDESNLYFTDKGLIDILEGNKLPTKEV